VIQGSSPSASTLARADGFIAQQLGPLGRVLGWGASSDVLLARVRAGERVRWPDQAATRRAEGRDSSVSPFDPESFDAFVTRDPELASTTSCIGEMARLLRDTGRFGMHLPLVPGRAGQPGWDELFRQLADVGLWPRRRLLLRELPGTGVPLRVRPAQLTALGSYAVVVGERIPRAAFRMREAIRISLQETGRARVTVVSGSMAPTYQIGEQVEVQPCTHARRGDVILFERGSQLVLHRVLARAGAYLVQRGDAERERASLIRDWRVIARVVT